ncbi:MAG: NUDIX domain-containing protein [Pseudomonadota bacterium]
MTLGVRAVVFNEHSEVLLVQHTYVEGWHFPGGGVERGEAAVQAMIKELREEANITLKSVPKLFHIYRNTQHSRFDHVVLFVCQHEGQTDPKVPDHEIAEARFFSINALPETVTKSTAQRMQEVLHGVPKSDIW